MEKTLNRHPRAPADVDLPSEHTIMRFVVEAEGHWFQRERRGHREFDQDGQATLRVGNYRFNVVRLLLQHRLGLRTLRAKNLCGLSQCVYPAHWHVLQDDAPVEWMPVLLLPTDRGWVVTRDGEALTRDNAFNAAQHPSSVVHIIRAMYDDGVFSFVTACKQAVDPAMLVVSQHATCAECLR